MARLLPLLLLTALLVPSPARAAAPTELGGTWVFDEASGGREARAAAIEQRVQEFPKLLRGIARKRLTAAVTIRERYLMQTDGVTITIRSDANAEGWTSDLAGTPVAVTTARGEEVQLTRRFEQGELRTRVDSERGWTSHVFVVDGARMELRVEVHNEQLDEPLAYTLLYRRD